MYTDPTVGGLLLQSLLGGFALLGTLVVLFWHRIKIFTRSLVERVPFRRKSDRD